MKLLTASTESAATALNTKALAYVVAEQNANATAWSDVFTDGSKFGIVYDDSIRSAFTNSELGASTTGTGMDAVTTYSKVIDGERKETDPQGNVTGIWEPV